MSLTKDIDQVGQRTTTINNRSRVAASTEDNIHHHHAQQHHQQGKTKKGIFNRYINQVFTMSRRDLQTYLVTSKKVWTLCHMSVAFLE